MKLLTKFPVYLKLRCSPKTQFKHIARSLFYGPNLTANVNSNPVCDTGDADFPHLKYAIEQEAIFWTDYISRRKALATELCEECSFEENITLRKTITLLKLSLEGLKELGLFSNLEDFMNHALRSLEPFPVLMDETHLKGFVRFKNKPIDSLPISIIKTSIEKQYLAWKFQVSFEVIERMFKYLRWSKFLGRSLQSLQRNVELLNECHLLKEADMSKQIYVLSEMAFNSKVLEDCQDTLFGLDWLQMGICYPTILNKPYYLIILRVKALQDEGFSDEQLTKALTVLNMKPEKVIKVLNFFKGLPHIYKYRNDLYFLRLLYLYHRRKFNDTDWSQTNYEDLKGELIKHEKLSKGFSDLIKFPRIAIEFYLKLKLGSSDEQLGAMKNGFKKYTYSMRGLSDTLSFLLESNFTLEEINDCITILFYPRHVIQDVLNTMRNNTEALGKFGFVDGHVTGKNFFKHGSSLKNKTLHICLYFIQKSNNFLIG